MKRIRILWLIMMLLAGWLACEEENSGYDRALLADTNWELKASKFSPGVEVLDKVTTDRYEIMANCQKDDIYRFNGDGTFELKPGDNTCETTYAEMVSGEWNLLDDNQKIKLVSSTGETITWTIEELNKSTLKVQYKTTINDSEQTITDTYKRVR